MSLTSSLGRLEARGAYSADGVVSKRWGQLLRETETLDKFLEAGAISGRLVPLREIAELRGGVVTRANAYFIVREIPFDAMPARFSLTRRDLQSITVVLDGNDMPFRMERRFLRPILKGPDTLLTPTSYHSGDERLLVITESKSQLRTAGASGAIAYLRQGETIPYSASEDSLKGGIPAERANIRTRRPYWYSLVLPESSTGRIVVPEHFNRRYIATLLSPGDDAVVIDKLYVINSRRQEYTNTLHASLNALLTWYQIELRGRTQLGEGVLEAKVPDWNGILVLNPANASAAARGKLADAFRPLSRLAESDSIESASSVERIAYDQLYLKFCGSAHPESLRLEIERDLRAAIAERTDRKVSVVDAKSDRRRSVRATASVDAYAARIAAGLSPYPDPREFLPVDVATWPVPIVGRVVGPIEIGSDFFDQGAVLSSGQTIAHAGDILSAQFVQAVLTHDPELVQVDVPAESALASLMVDWRNEVQAWRARFSVVSQDVIHLLADDRLKGAVLRQALSLLHAV